MPRRLRIRMTTQIPLRKLRPNHASYRVQFCGPTGSFLIRRNPCHPRITSAKEKSSQTSGSDDCRADVCERIGLRFGLHQASHPRNLHELTPHFVTIRVARMADGKSETGSGNARRDLTGQLRILKE
ncbi:MAG: hypothetical protein O2983_08120 [Planctomycetota bacterium]|nr:hypothetical protein [Planctomycetota bacterium]MDA1159562.1 hypothetical protein [Planctomycetota bacterium]